MRPDEGAEIITKIIFILSFRLETFVVLCTALLWHSFSEYILTRCKLFLRATVRLAVIFIEIIKFQSQNIYKANQ